MGRDAEELGGIEERDCTQDIVYEKKSIFNKRKNKKSRLQIVS